MLAGGEERIQGAGADLGAHPEPGVGDGNHDVVALRDPRMLGCEKGIEMHILGFDAENTAFGHRFAGVDAELEHGAFHLDRVDQRRPRWPMLDDVEGHFGADDPLDQVLHGHHERGNVRHLGPENLTPRESQQAADEPATLLRRADDLARQSAAVFVGDSFLGEEPRIAGDDGQQIVELMRDSGGEVPDRTRVAAIVSALLRRPAVP